MTAKAPPNDGDASAAEARNMAGWAALDGARPLSALAECLRSGQIAQALLNKMADMLDPPEGGGLGGDKRLAIYGPDGNKIDWTKLSDAAAKRALTIRIYAEAKRQGLPSKKALYQIEKATGAKRSTAFRYLQDVKDSDGHGRGQVTIKVAGDKSKGPKKS